MRNEALPGYALGQLIAGDFPARSPLLGSWLVERSLNMVHASAGRGKSIFCMALALAIAGGGEYLGWKAPKPRRVLYVDAEMDPRDLQERAADLLNASQMTDEQKAHAAANLHIVPQQATAPAQRLPDLRKDAEAAANQLVRWCEHQEAALVIIDNLTTLAEIDDENSAGAFSFALTIGDRLKSNGVAVLYVHHNRKGNGGAESFRGSGKLEAPLDTRWELGKPDSAAALGNALAFTVEPHKVRIKRGEDVRKFTALFDAEGGVWQTLEPEAPEKLKALLEAVRSEQYASQKDLADALGISKGQVSKLKRQAFAGGLITEDEFQSCIEAARDADF